MPAKKKATKAKKPLMPKTKTAATKLSTGKLESVKAQEVVLRYVEKAYKFSAARRSDEIHPRKVIPKTKSGRSGSWYPKPNHANSDGIGTRNVVRDGRTMVNIYIYNEKLKSKSIDRLKKK